MNIVEIIKKAPKDHVYWCTLSGECKVEIDYIDKIFPIRAKFGDDFCFITADGRYFEGDDGECVLFPSKDNRDWAAFERELDGKEQQMLVPDDAFDGSKFYSKDNFNGTFDIGSIPDRPMMAAVICAGLLAGGCKDKGAALINKAVNYADMILDYTKEESNERNNN